MNKGFTILEVITAIFVLIVGVGAAFSLINQTLSAYSIVGSRFVASYLAQEGIEIVRNIRDGNWLEQRSNPSSPPSWKEDLVGCTTCCEVDYKMFSSLNSPSGCDYDNLDSLNIDADGFYGYGPGTQTKFKRKVFVQEIGVNTIGVSVEVMWKERGRLHSVKVSEELTNWAGI